MTCCFRRFPVALLLELAQSMLLFLLILLRLCVQLVQAAPVPLLRALAVTATTFSILRSCLPSGFLELVSVIVLFACLAVEVMLHDRLPLPLPVARERKRR